MPIGEPSSRCCPDDSEILWRGEKRSSGGLSGGYLHQKFAIAVDEDVDIYDPTDIAWR